MKRLAFGLLLARIFFCFLSEAFAESSPLPFEDRKTHLWGYKTSAGAVVIRPQFLVAERFSPYGIAAVANETGWKYINKKGERILEPFIFDNGPDPFREGLARFKQSEKLGFFDRRGKVIIPARFDFAAPFSDGLALFCEGCIEHEEGEHSSFRGGKWGFIDKKGEIVIAPQFEEAKSFERGRAQVMLNEKWIIVDRKGERLQ